MNHRRLCLLLAACAGLALCGALYPLYVIRPFRAQGPRELEAALLVLRLRPAGTLLCLGTAAVAIYRFRHLLTRRSAQVAAAGALLLTLLASAAVRVNVFELMFHPSNSPRSNPPRRPDWPLTRWSWRLNRAAPPGPIRSAPSPTITSSTTPPEACPSWQRIERSVTPVWCGSVRWAS